MYYFCEHVTFDFCSDLENVGECLCTPENSTTQKLSIIIVINTKNLTIRKFEKQLVIESCPFNCTGSPQDIRGCWLKCCFTSTETVGLLGLGAQGQDDHLNFHAAPELCQRV